jgi:hypothetical protein
MTDTQRDKLSTCNRVIAYNTAHATDLATIAEYAAEETAFANAMTIINAAAQVQSGTAGTTTDAVAIAKEKMAKTVIKYALRGLVKAKQTSNVTLANHLNHTISYISKASKTLSVQRSKDIRKQLNDNLATLTNVTAANITEIDTAITGYDTIKDQPIIAIQTTKATGTDPLPAAFTKAFAAIDSMFDLITSYFADTNKTLVDEFALAKQIISTGTHHTGVTGTATKGGNPVKDTVVTIDETDKTAKSDIEGHYTISKVQAGTFSITATLPTGETQSKIAHISKGNFETIDFAF